MNNKPIHIKEIVMPMLERLDATGTTIKHPDATPTGFEELDKLIGGLQPSNLIAIGARPGMGKTSFALSIALNAAMKQEKTVCIFSYEMSNQCIVNRILEQMSKIECGKLMNGKTLSEKECEIVRASAEVLANCNLYIDDTGSNTVADMKAKLKEMKSVDLVIIDYLQLIPGDKRPNLCDDANDIEICDSISENLAQMSKELNLPVIVLSQLPRYVEYRHEDERRPMRSDLKMCGLDKYADVIMFLYRGAYYDDQEDNSAAECIVAKNRNGGTGTIRLIWDELRAAFESV